MKIKQNAQSGFTLIELVMVIVILGILAATALPKFVDLQDDAETAAAQGVAGALSSAAAINYAACAAKNQAVTADKCVKVAACSDVGKLLNPSLTLSATVSTTAYYLDVDEATTTNGESVSCSLKKGSATVAYTAIGAAN